MAKKKSSLINMVLTLFIVCLVASATLGFIYELTKEPIELAKAKKQEYAIKQVLPEFDKVGEIQKVKDGKKTIEMFPATRDGKLVGVAVKTFTKIGYSGEFWIMVGFEVGKNNPIFNITVLEHKETPGLGDKMERKKSDWSDQFKGKSVATNKIAVKKDGGEIDAITAATISSRAFCDAVQRAYKAYKSKYAN